jgi:hypothetical protein
MNASMNFKESDWKPDSPTPDQPAALEKVAPKKRRKRMSFEKEMDQFFARNCFSAIERHLVKTWPAYQLAVQRDDLIEAQEIAVRLLEGS